MKKLISIILTVLMLASSFATNSFAGKENSNNFYDFNNQTSEGITLNTNANYYSVGFEAGIGGKSSDDYAYKFVAEKHDSTSGSKAMYMDIPTKFQNGDNIAYTEFELYSSVTGKPSAKDGQTPYIVIKSSGKQLVYIRTRGIEHGAVGGWGKIETNPDTFMNKWTDFAVAVNKTDNTVALYINGAVAASGISLGTTADLSTLSVGWEYFYDAPGDDCWFAIDNINCYSAKEINELPYNSYDFNNGTSLGIKLTTNANYYSTGLEAGIDGKSNDDYAYKFVATKHDSTSGSKAMYMDIPTGAQNGDNIVFTEFEMYPHITAKSTAKDKQTPYVVIKSSGKQLIYIRMTAIAHSALGGWGAIESQPAAYMNKWSKFSVAINKNDNTFNFYINNAEVASGISLGTTADASTLSIGWEYYYDAPGDDCWFAIDNIKSFSVTEIKEPMFKAVTAQGYSVNSQNSSITVPAYSTGADLVANVLPDDGCTVSLVDVLGNSFDLSRQISRNTKVVLSNDISAKIYTVNVSNQLANDDFDSWTLSEIDISDATSSGQLTTGVDSIKWCDWSANANGSIAIESEAGKGKVLRITSDETLSETEYSGQSIGLTAYTTDPYLIKEPTVGKTWVLSCDVKADIINNPAGVLFQDASGEFIDCIKLGGGGIANDAERIGKMYENKWYNCTTVINVQDGTCITYIDGVLASSKEIASSSSNISQIRLYVNKVKGINQSVWFDNFTMYEFDSVSDYDASAFSTSVTSTNENVIIGKGSLKNIIRLNGDVSVDALKSALISDSGAQIEVSGANPGDVVTVKSKNAKNTAEYVIANENGIADFDFKTAVNSDSTGYISADCEYTSSQKPLMVAALYNGNKLVKLGSVGEDLSSVDFDGYLSGGISVDEDDEWTVLKIMLVESYSNLKPLGLFKYIQNK